MNDLFRFLMLRPANSASSEDKKVLEPSFADSAVPFEAAKAAAKDLVESNELPVAPGELAHADVAAAVLAALSEGPVPEAVINDIVMDMTGDTSTALVESDSFVESEQRVADSLVAMKLLSSSLGADAPAFSDIAGGYDAIRSAASGAETVSLRVLQTPRFAASPQLPAVPEPERPPEPPPARKIEKAQRAVQEYAAAIARFTALPAAAFAAARVEAETAPDPRIAQMQARLAALEVRSGEALSGAVMSGSSATVGRRWFLPPEAVASMPHSVKTTLSNSGIDPHQHSLPFILESLQTLQDQASATVVEATTGIERGLQLVIEAEPFKVPGSTGSDADLVGKPKGAMPTGHGNIQPVGVGDLLVVKQHLLRYEGGDLAHVENVLKSEKITRETRRLDRTETTIFHETETTKEEQRDTQTTERFSLKREASDTIKSESELKAGISISAKYGPFVEVKANADYSTKDSSESATKQASEFSKDVVARSASKLVERVLDRRSTTTISEFEEKYAHEFDNTKGAGHISGYYQWIDKVLQAQVYNYGKRLLFDVTLPEPGTNYVVASRHEQDGQQETLQAPPPFTLTADQLNSGNYLTYAKLYDAVGLEPPPPYYKNIAKAYDRIESQSPHQSTKTEIVQLEDGYKAKYAYLSGTSWVYPGSYLKVLVAGLVLDPDSGLHDLAGETGSIPVGYLATHVQALVITIEVLCERTNRAMAVWQLKAHAGISQAYQAKVLQYEQRLAQAKTEAGTVIAGRNPVFNQRLINSELRKQCLELVTNQHFDGFGALQTGPYDTVQPNIAATEAQMPYVRFFEQAFEWEHLVYFFYPYFWGLKKAWKTKQLADNVDDLFGDFLRAGAARVVFPVRPGFETAVVHYLETGEIWNGGPPPTLASTNLYVPIIKEIQEATGAPGDEKPVGEPWLVHLPTTLVRLRPSDDLPEWQKVGEDWQPKN